MFLVCSCDTQCHWISCSFEDTWSYGPIGYVIGICQETWLSMKLFVLKCSTVRRVSLVLYIFLHLVDQRRAIGIWYQKSRVLDEMSHCAQCIVHFSCFS